MKTKISVLIPTYKEPDALDLCLKSCIEGCSDLNQIEIIVGVDGFYEENKEVLDKYKDYIKLLNLPENVGMIKMMNLLTYNASSELVFHVQDDNVFPLDWDKKLLNHYQPNSVLTPNQIEPTPSMFRQFEICDYGRDPKTFDLTYFQKDEDLISENKLDESGSTFPFLISKIDYLRIGGIDESYPGPWVCDWEYFMKCRLAGMKMLRTYNCHFYHFVSLGTVPTPEKQQEKNRKEFECYEYAKYKFGEHIKHNPLDNSKYL